MAIYQGRINCRKLAGFINEKLLAEGFTQISSDLTTDGYVFKSMGTSGNDEWYFRVKEEVNNHLTVGVFEKYTPKDTPGSGTFSAAGDSGAYLTWHKTLNMDRYDVDYIMNVTKDRVIIHVQGMKAESNSCSSLVYAGLPKRYDPSDKAPNCALLAASTRAAGTVRPRIMRGRMLDINPTNYTWEYYPFARSYGYGKQLFFSPIVLGTTAEGPRGELDGLYFMENIDQTYEILHKDTFQRNGKTYMVLSRDKEFNANSMLPVGSYVIEI